MEIAEYREKYGGEVIELWFKCKLVVPSNNPRRDIERKVEVDRDLLLVGIINGKVVATVMGGYEGHRGWINYLAVDPEHRNNGYGRLIMREVEKRIRARGCPKINLQVRATNDRMINFHNVNISKLVFAISAFMLTVLSGCSSAPSAKPGSVLISRQTCNPWAGDLFSLDTGGVFLYVSSLKRKPLSMVCVINPLLLIYPFWQNKISKTFNSATTLSSFPRG